MDISTAATMLLGSIPHGKPIDTDNLTNAYEKALKETPENETELDKAFETLWNFKGKFPKATTKTSEFPKGLIESLATLDGTSAKICGTWIWVDGSTAQHNATLKSLGLKFGKKKQKWYWSPPGSKARRKKGGMSYDWIINKYGERDLEAA